MINLQEKIKKIIVEILPQTDPSSLSEETRLQEDLCFDSLNMMMLLVRLEEVFSFKFSSSVHFETLSDVCGYLSCRI